MTTMFSSEPQASLDSPHFLELTQVSRLLRARELSPVELCQAMLRRIAQLDPSLHAYVQVMTDGAMASARQAETEICQGLYRGPLHGVPIAIKDIFWTEGAPTAAGMSMHRDFMGPEDATVVARLRDAGAVLMGRLTLTEGVYAEHRAPYVAPLNPWSDVHWPGASSSGSAVAVASGLCFGALASETGGSIKLPSAVNGVTGIKPTWGRVSRHGVFELAATLDHVGAMGRSAADAAAMLGAIAGADVKDPTASRRAVPDYLHEIQRGVCGVRIGLDPAWTHAGVDPVTSAALDSAVAVLAEQGAQLEHLRLPDGSAMIWDWFGVCAVETAIAHEATFPSRAAEYGPALKELLRTGRSLGGMEHQRLLQRRDAFSRALDRVFEEVDLIALPVLAFPAPLLERWEHVDDELIAGLHRFTCPFNMSRHPGIVLPCGFTADRTPIVFQLVGRHFGESELFAAAHAFQQVTDWHRVHPFD